MKTAATASDKNAVNRESIMMKAEPNLAQSARNMCRMIRFHTVFAMIAILATSSLASAGPYQDSVAAYLRGDFIAAHKLSKPLAEQGNKRSQFLLGALYAEGRGVPQDYVEASKWLRRAADQGDSYAQFHLGTMYDEGKGLSQDRRHAAEWFRRAADQGIIEAQFNLGALYERGEGVPQDFGEAVKWYRMAAEQGSAAGQLNLGAMYAEGKGVPRNYVISHMWTNLAAASLKGEAGKKANTNRDTIGKLMTPAQVERAHDMARQCLKSNFKKCE